MTREVAAGVWVVDLPLPESATVDTTNGYLIADSDGGVHLVDPGWDTDENLALLEAALAEAGFGLPDVRSITATHAHPDHLGLALRLHAEHGIPVGTAPEPAGDAATRDVSLDPGNVALQDGDRLPIPGRDVRVVTTPGHTAGSICLSDTSGLFFSGDHVLPNVNPGIGLGGFGPDGDPIGDALDSYAKVAAYDDTLVLPGHGEPFRGLAARAAELAEHHARRTREIGALAAQHPDWDVEQLAPHVRWSGGWDALTPLLRRSALRQTELHLRHVRRATLDG